MFSSQNSQVSNDANYIEDVFSTYLYTGNDSTQTITNGIDLAGKGGLVWGKKRGAAGDHYFTDTVRGNTPVLKSNSTAAQVTNETVISGFNSNGFGITDIFSDSGVTYASWTFRKQPKFFDVVTYTGTGSNTTIAHNLGSVPGCIIVKRTDAAGYDWRVYHRGLTSAEYSIQLNATSAQGSGPTIWNSTSPTSTVFSVGTNASVNASGGTYVAYLFAHNAGGFGLTGTDNVISCGSYTGNGADPGPDINLGYEAQWVLIKNASDAASWRCFDVMRGMPVGAGDAILQLNSAAAESTQDCIRPTATGFQLIGADQAGGVAYNVSGNTYIYIAIRRGPMKVPTSGTSVYNAKTITGTNATNPLTGVGFAPDLLIASHRNTNAITHPTYWDKLRGRTQYITSSSTASEGNTLQSIVSFDMDGITLGEDGLDLVNKASGTTYVHWLFKRAPSFFDEVCYTGNGTSTPFNHNLGVTPELIITKIRDSGTPNWGVWHKDFSPFAAMAFLNTTAVPADGYVNAVSSTQFSFATGNGVVNTSTRPYVAYLFATCAGVSKVGSYTGTGTTLQVNCGFTAGARFVLIKRTDSTGDWYVWDTARGIVSGNDPYLLLNSTAAEVTSTDYIDTYSAGFEISSTAPAAINASGGTFIYLAIA
jgi:hypothetical protein